MVPKKIVSFFFWLKMIYNISNTKIDNTHSMMKESGLYHAFSGTKWVLLYFAFYEFAHKVFRVIVKTEEVQRKLEN